LNFRFNRAIAVVGFDNDMEECDMNHRFIRRLPGGSVYHLGTAVQYADGWRFLSNVSSHKSSRKFHPTMEKCLPRWVGYPNKCESVVVGGPTDEFGPGYGAKS
jgi:hypothetical protein